MRHKLVQHAGDESAADQKHRRALLPAVLENGQKHTEINQQRNRSQAERDTRAQVDGQRLHDRDTDQRRQESHVLPGVKTVSHAAPRK